MAQREIYIDSFAEEDRWEEAKREDGRLRGPWRPEYASHTYRDIIETVIIPSSEGERYFPDSTVRASSGRRESWDYPHTKFRLLGLSIAALLAGAFAYGVIADGGFAQIKWLAFALSVTWNVAWLGALGYSLGIRVRVWLGL